MSNLRKAAEAVVAHWQSRDGLRVSYEAQSALIALEAALIEPETVQEPVAWGLWFESDSRPCHRTMFDTEQEAQEYADSCWPGTTAAPLYTAPPQSHKQEALASMYIAWCDAMYYHYSDSAKYLHSPEEWAAHLYAKTQKTLTDGEMLQIIDNELEGGSLLDVARAVQRAVKGEKE